MDSESQQQKVVKIYCHERELLKASTEIPTLLATEVARELFASVFP